MNKKTRLLIRATMVAIIPALIVVGVALAASSINLGGYQIDFLGVEPPNPADSHVWTYAITEPDSSVFGLSHWTLSIPDCGYEVIEPKGGDEFTTLTSLTECGPTYNCEAAKYDVVYEISKLPDMLDLKFEFADVKAKQLDGTSAVQHTHIFRFKTETSSKKIIVGLIDILLKFGQTTEIDDIKGPWCDPSAVQLVSFEDSKGSRLLIQGTLAVMLGVILLGSGNLVLRRRRK